MTVLVRTNSPEETTDVGARVGRHLTAGDLLCLTGDLGSGKTVFARGVCRALGCRERVKSPSFVLVREYHGDVPVFHIDLYRLGSPDEWSTLGIDDRLEEAVALIEWGELMGSRLPDETIRVEIISCEGRDGRDISITWSDPRMTAIRSSLDIRTPHGKNGR